MTVTGDRKQGAGEEGNGGLEADFPGRGRNGTRPRAEKAWGPGRIVSGTVQQCASEVPQRALGPHWIQGMVDSVKELLLSTGMQLVVSAHI